jgi:hypothetical protein
MNMVKLVTSNLITQAMNAIAEETISMEGLQQGDNTATRQPAAPEEMNWPMGGMVEVP